MTRDDRGSALIEFVWLGLLLLVPLVYLVLTASDVQRAAYGASTASRAAGRAFVLAPDTAAAYDRAERAARTALADQGIVEASVDVECAPSAQSCLTPGSAVTVVVTVRQQLPLAPDVFGGAAPAITVDARHTEPYGTFREDRS
ncbi:hypothetical protein [Solicola gregarius]|uniref:TadE family protein n=1 Tax=Solicola gregarius TaxID=2908642 RepID=A0AA46TF39_9ACTN|nr:hypothetical protein [Solicola gregarius]UYM04075.1 hypothetical protein L0C25_16195 [Solicola gregarius]